ncbi:gamma-tubulin complex component protein [Syncephalis fuscata]|nr:gamma-tubulin complex component protein [Syncephalis fuscata]
MLHELLLALAGYPGDVFVARSGSFVVATDLTFLSEQEYAVLNRLGRLGWAYHTCMQFIRQQKKIDNTPVTGDKEGDSCKGIYLDAFCEGLDRALDDYRNRLEKLEVGMITSASTIYIDNVDVQAASSKFNVHTITDVLFVMMDYEIIFPAILSILEEIQTHPRHWHGVVLVERLRVQYQESGVPLLRDLLCQLTMAGMRVLWRQITAWLVYGLLRDPFKEFFIQERSDALSINSTGTSGRDSDMAGGEGSAHEQQYEPVWRRKHRLLLASVPAWIGAMAAEDVLFTGQVVLAVQERGYRVPEVWTQTWLQKLHALFESMVEQASLSSHRSHIQLKVNSDLFIQLARTARRDLSEWLWRTAVQQYRAAHQLEAFRNYYLLGRGDFFDALLDGVDNHKGVALAAAVHVGTPVSTTHGNSMPSSTTSIRDRELRSLWSRAAANTTAEDDDCFARFRLERAPELTDADVFGAPARLHYHLDWPFDLVVAPTELARYDTVFLYLLAVRSAQRRLQRAKWHVHLRESSANLTKAITLRKLWYLRNTMQCFVDQIWAHIQMDVIDVHFKRLRDQIQDAAKQPSNEKEIHLATAMNDNSNEELQNGYTKEHDFTDLQLAHTKFLDAVCKGCFISMPAVFKAIRDAVRCCAQLAGFIEREQGMGKNTLSALDTEALTSLEKVSKSPYHCAIITC